MIFQVHRIVLCGCSDYFKAMFSHDMLEKKIDNLQLDVVPVKGMELIVEFAYTGKLSLSLETLPYVLATASFLQVTNAIKLCHQFMTDNMHFDNA